MYYLCFNKLKNNLMGSEIFRLNWFEKSLQDLLKPCPFCGSTDIAIHVPNNEGKEDITCLTCGCKMQKALGVGVVSSWNKRV